MFRIEGRLIKNNHACSSHIAVITDSNMRRTQKVFSGLEEICYTLDLSKPIWFESNKREFIQRAKTRFSKDNFVDSRLDFDYLELSVIEEE